MLDRIDIHIEVTPVKYTELQNKDIKEESSKEIRRRVDKARNIQISRYEDDSIFSNSQLTSRHLEKYCKVDDEGKMLLKEAFKSLGFSARAYNRILKVSRTIADLDGKKLIECNHIAEAIQYRSLDRKFWR